MCKKDVVIIGAGVIGCSIARYLSRYVARVLVIEREEDVCSGTSKANSGIVHAGFDAMPGSIMAKMNVRGCEMMPELSRKLDFPYINNGSLVLCFREEDRNRLRELYDRGVKNGVKGLQIISGDVVRRMEPEISSRVVEAMWAPTAGIVCPFLLTIAMAENAADNDVEFRFTDGVEKIENTENGFRVTTQDGTEILTKTVVNAAGVYADVFHNMISAEKIEITPRRGEYILLDNEVGGLVKSTVFQLPSVYGKGVLVTPTVHGNVLIGPNARELSDKEDTEITTAGLEEVKTKARDSVPNIPFGKMITSFSGLRAHEKNGDFILGEELDHPGFFDAAGIESPGLTAAPAIGEFLADQVAVRLKLSKKQDFQEFRRGIPVFSKLAREEQEKLLKLRPDYGNVVCRCEQITEGEIRDAIRRTLGAKSLDGIKRRVRQGMGRCQAGFCTPKTMEILAEELGISLEEVVKNRPGSEMILG